MTPSAIRALREHVEAGKPYNPEYYDTITAAFGFNHHWQNMLVISAWVKGSLDAAMALHEAVLPEWSVDLHERIVGNGRRDGWNCDLMDLTGRFWTYETGSTVGAWHKDMPARALFIATLRALEQEAKGNG